MGVTAALRHQGGAEHSRSAYAFDRPKWVCLSHAHRHARTHLESPQRFCTAEVRGSNPLGSTLESVGSKDHTAALKELSYAPTY
jgi:hypothetical protein